MIFTIGTFPEHASKREVNDGHASYDGNKICHGLHEAEVDHQIVYPNDDKFCYYRVRPNGRLYKRISKMSDSVIFSQEYLREEKRRMQRRMKRKQDSHALPLLDIPPLNKRKRLSYFQNPPEVSEVVEFRSTGEREEMRRKVGNKSNRPIRSGVGRQFYSEERFTSGWYDRYDPYFRCSGCRCNPCCCFGGKG